MYRALTAHIPLGESRWATRVNRTEALGEVAVVEFEAQDGIRRYFSGQIVEARVRGRHAKVWGAVFHRGGVLPWFCTFQPRPRGYDETLTR
jgi:hypothetical protein